MTHGLPLFSYDPRYPARAGFKEATTSRDAADAIEAAGRAARLRNAVFSLYRSGFTGTADEAAHQLAEDILSIRPRVAELHKQGLLEPTGERRKADGGRAAHCWRFAWKVGA